MTTSNKIDDLTFGELKQIAAMFNERKVEQPPTLHPAIGKNVLAILPSGFIYFGILTQYSSGDYGLENASNLRYWKTRNGGLPEFAEKGPVSDDKIDKVSGTVFFEGYVAILPLGDWYE